MNIFDTIKADIETAWTDAEHFIEAEAVTAWGLFKSTVTAFSASELTNLQALVGTVIADPAAPGGGRRPGAGPAPGRRSIFPR